MIRPSVSLIILAFLAQINAQSYQSPSSPVSQTCTAGCNVYPAYFNASDSVMLLLDYQTGVLNYARSTPQKWIIANMRILARFASALNIPVVLTSSQETGFQGPMIDDLKTLLPDAFAARIQRNGPANPWDYMPFRDAVTKAANGRKNVIIAGLTNDVCVTYPAMSMVQAGYNVVAVQDAGGSPNKWADEGGRRHWERAGARTLTTNALAFEMGKDWSTPDGVKIVTIVAEELIMKLNDIDGPRT
ncbi:probable hydrolase YcaC [Paramacrobiotus metropolitanus]|uniref:probable hydrolase YcaC n=1 Tax=Paramacrobiotus metropolitanus TaxID=2943436 RepID=UPI0024465C52|nr:probable hydrolase YcaC [Paramacrobiotus metropolitanus]